MNIEKSLQRIGWRFGQNKAFTPNAGDIQAYNELVEYHEMKKAEQVTNHKLFCKLYIFLFREFTRHYQATVMDEIPQKELHKILDREMGSLIHEVMEDLNMFELQNTIKEQRHKDYKPMTYEEVAESLNIMVAGALDNYNK